MAADHIHLQFLSAVILLKEMTTFVSGDYSDDDDESDDTEDAPAVENAKESKGKAKEEQLDNAMADFMAVKVLPS